MVVDRNLAISKFQNNTANAAQDFAVAATNAAGQWERNVKAPQAKQNWQTGIQQAVQNDSWARGLSGTTAADFAAGVQLGAQSYATKTPASAQKWLDKTGKYLDIIDRHTAQMQARQPGLDPVQQFERRAGAMVRDLQAAKRQGVVGARFTAPTLRR